MISLDSPMWKELDSAGGDTDEILRDLVEGKGDFREQGVFRIRRWELLW